MTFVSIKPTESLMKKLSELYIGYIGIKKEPNKFNIMFDEIEKNIEFASVENMNTYLCASLKQRYLDGLTQLLERSKTTQITLETGKKKDDLNLQNAKKYLKTKIELIEYLINFINEFSYDTLTSVDACRISYYLALDRCLEQIKNTVKDNAIPLLYEHITGDIRQVIDAEEIKKIEETNAILMGDKKAESIQFLKKIETHFNMILDIPDDTKYLLSQLEKKYREFISIGNLEFSQEVKNKIKKSVILLVFAEIKIQKRLNLSKPLLVTNVLKKFFAL